MKVRITRVHENSSDIPLPSYATSGSAGMDVRADINDEMTLQPGEFALVPTGLAIELPHGYEAQIRPRSGLAARHGIILPNAPGTIDSDYRGEIKVILANFGREPFVIRRGDRIAQMVVAPVTTVEWEEVPGLHVTMRGDGGFGHSGRS